MPKEKKEKAKKRLSIESLRYSEYYEMQETFDELYARSKKGENFNEIFDIMFSKENIILAYRNIKANAGSKTPGTDNLTIDDVGRLSPEEVVEKVKLIINGEHGYRPKPARRVEIPKPYDPTKTRPLGIPCIWDRLIQQSVKQIMEPICEAKFSDNSYGFRPNRSVEHAISAVYNKLNFNKLYYVVEFDIKGFFDNVDHSKLLRKIWAMGIRDKHLLYLIKRILKALVKMPGGNVIFPEKGTPQGGIISPLLANITLNELDRWVESNWEENPIAYKYSVGKNANGSKIKSNGYRAMRKTRLKEMFMVRYADDFRIFCRTKNEAERTKTAVTQWLSQRLKLEVSQKKTRIVNVKQKYMEFLGFKIKVYRKGRKHVVTSHISDKQLIRKRQVLCEQAKNIAKPRPGKTEADEIRLYNSKVMGIQNYYRIATNISWDCAKINRAVMTILTNRLRTGKKGRLRKEGRKLTKTENERYGKSSQMRYSKSARGAPIYPISYAQHKNPMGKKRGVSCYTPEGRKEIHDNLKINVNLMRQLMRRTLYKRSVEYADNRVALFSAQRGKCAVTGREFELTEEIHCHHKIPKGRGGTDKYSNLILVLEPIHKLIHATKPEAIAYYKEVCKLDNSQRGKLNRLRQTAELKEIS